MNNSDVDFCSARRTDRSNRQTSKRLTGGRVPHLYQDVPLEPGASLALSGDATHHLLNVLRLPFGSSIILWNGDGCEYRSTLMKGDRRQANALIAACQAVTRESPLMIHLGQVISKGDRMDFTLQKATELGVTQITPLFSQKTGSGLEGAHVEKKQAHWAKVIISACEQSGRNRLPILLKPEPLNDWVQNRTEATKLIACPLASAGLKEQPLTSPIALLIGGEGGLTFDENQQAQQQGFLPFCLGPRILRTETAGLVAIAALQLLAGDF